MVVGNGLLANIFKNQYAKNDDFIIFASGVSNSKINDDNLFLREITLLQNTILQNKHKHIVYFSTCSIYDISQKESPYVMHKHNAENTIKTIAKKYTIFRLPNLVGHTNNTTTVINYFYNCINNQQPFTLWKNAERNIIDIEDVYHTVHHILHSDTLSNTTINTANPHNYTPQYIVDCIEKFLHKKAIYTTVDKGSSFNIDISMVLPIYELLKIYFSENYLTELLQKYYAP